MTRYWAVLFVACALHGSVRGESNTSVSVSSDQPLLAEIHETGWLDGDCAYHAVHISPDGNVYFTVSTHVAQQSARVYAFEPATRKVRLLWTVDQTVQKDGSVTQGKIHGPLGEIGEELYLGTHDSWYSQDHTDPATGRIQSPYKGGYVIAINKQTGKGRVIALPLGNRPATAYVSGRNGMEEVRMDGEGLVATILDEERGLFYALSWPSGYFVKMDLTNGRTSEYGGQCHGGEAVPKVVTKDGKEQPNPEHNQVNRALALDSQGDVYGSRCNGEIWKYDLKADRVVVMNARMERGSGLPIRPELARQNQWRTILWDGDDRVFYGVVQATSWLFRLDPWMDRIEPLTAWRPQKARSAPVQKDYAQLGLGMGPDHTLYGLVHADSVRPTAKRSVHLITYNLGTGKYKDQGVVQASNGSALMFVESCGVAPNGDVYAVGWMEAEESRRKQAKAAREKGPPEVRGYAYLMSLVRIPAAHLAARP